MIFWKIVLLGDAATAKSKDKRSGRGER